MSIRDSHILRIAEDNRESFAALHDLLYDRLFFYTYKLTGDIVESEDLIQDTFLHYWERRVNFSDFISVKVYLYSILDYKLRNHLRKRQRQSKLLKETPIREPYENEYLIITAEITGQVRQALRKLPPQTGRVMELSMQEMSLEEIAGHLNISINTVKTLKKAGYKALRESLSHLRSILPLLIP